MDIKEYLALPYTRIIQELTDESGHYFYGRILEIDGCQSTAETLDELYPRLNEALEGCIELLLQEGRPVPVPLALEEYSGRFLLRLPKSLHQKLTIEAEQEGVSINQLAIYKLAR